MNLYLDFLFFINNTYSSIKFFLTHVNYETFLEFQQRRLQNLESQTSRQLFQYFYNVNIIKFNSRNYQYVNRYLFYNLQIVSPTSKPILFNSRLYISLSGPILFDSYLHSCAISFRFLLDQPLTTDELFELLNEPYNTLLNDAYLDVRYNAPLFYLRDLVETSVLTDYYFDYECNNAYFFFENSQGITEVQSIYRNLPLFQVNNFSTNLLKIKH